MYNTNCVISGSKFIDNPAWELKIFDYWGEVHFILLTPSSYDLHMLTGNVGRETANYMQLNTVTVLYMRSGDVTL